MRSIYRTLAVAVLCLVPISIESQSVEAQAPTVAVRVNAADPIYEPAMTVPVGGLCMVDVPGIPLDKFDFAIIGGSYTWDGTQVVYVPKKPIARVLLDARSEAPLLLVPTQEENRGVYHIVMTGGDALRIVPLTIGTGVAPVPPGPTPPIPVPPGPTPPPVVEGKRALLIIRESADTTPGMARLITALRNPPHADYLKSKGHTLSVLDDDAVDADGQPSPLVAAWREHFAGMTLPVLFVIDQNGNKLLHKESLPPTAGADAVIGLLKKFGG